MRIVYWGEYLGLGGTRWEGSRAEWSLHLRW